MLLTIFTPTYNRAYIIGALYHSLCSQTCHDFEWLIVDDGSTDDTSVLVSQFIKENRITIRYLKQTNGGKHRAINCGIREARGELFFIVDSDDKVSPTAVSDIFEIYRGISNDETFAGISGLRVHEDGSSRSIGITSEYIDATSLEIRYEHNVMGDLAEVFKTKVIRQYPFPEYGNEKFVPEALVWNRMARVGLKLRYTAAPLYVCEYLPDGLSAAAVSTRMNSPLASTTYYQELLLSQIPFLSKCKAAINYWRFYCCKSGATKPAIPINWSILLPLGFACHLYDMLSLRPNS